MNPTIKNLLMWMVLAFVLMTIFNSFNSSENVSKEQAYSAFLKQVESNSIQAAIIEGGQVKYITTSGDNYFTVIPNGYDDNLIDDLHKKNIDFKGKEPAKPSFLKTILISWFPMLLLIGVWIWFMRKQSGGGSGGGAMSFGKSKAKLLGEDQIKTRMADVAGCDEAKEEVVDLIEFLKDPTRFTRLGGVPPKGTLLVGPPGTGKTLLAKALAGEAKVPFYTISGSDFVEMFVGVGASRVRDMFELAKKNAPCILFIDEIDAVGKKRGGGMSGGHDEREQTLNQMLVEMDGFEDNEAVLILASTNRADVLDDALLRPGRFDRQVHVGLPDINGREQILKVHARKVPLADDADLSAIARGTPGFSGAKLESLINEAALEAAKSGKKTVDRESLRFAHNKIIMGKERKIQMSDEDKKATAYHEVCHALPGYIMHLMGHHDPVYAVSIVPRGPALGVTMYLPEEDRFSQNKGDLTAFIVSLLGGRRGEFLYHKGEEIMISTGASNDLERASDIARRMAKEWGFSSDLGLLTIKEDPYGRSTGAPESIASAEKAAAKWLKDADTYVQKLISENVDVIHKMSQIVFEKGTIYQDEIEEIFTPLREKYQDKKLDLELK
jgi:cell division protease FtsH